MRTQGAAPGVVEEVAPLHIGVDRVQRQPRDAEHEVDRVARGGPAGAIAQETLEAVGRFEADALDVQGEVALGVGNIERHTQEVKKQYR